MNLKSWGNGDVGNGDVGSKATSQYSFIEVRYLMPIPGATQIYLSCFRTCAPPALVENGLFIRRIIIRHPEGVFDLELLLISF